jgi:CRISPR/Cas system CMR-associated protein Cmr1 (group 7 of RAMP superfamily)
MLKEKGEKADRFASPLILRPFLCSDNKAVGLALLLEGSRVDADNLVLVEQDKDKKEHPVKATITRDEARNIEVLHGETDVLQAFMNILKGVN